MTILIETPITTFTTPLQSTQGDIIGLNTFNGHYLVLYFYPKNNTPGCTTQTLEFAEHNDAFKALNAVILGVSRDTLSSHLKFREKLNASFHLISDANEQLCNQFNVLRTKMMYGKQVRGIERSTFIFDTTGHLIREWRGVKVDGHVIEVFNYLKTLSLQSI